MEMGCGAGRVWKGTSGDIGWEATAVISERKDGGLELVGSSGKREMVDVGCILEVEPTGRW